MCILFSSPAFQVFLRDFLGVFRLKISLLLSFLGGDYMIPVYRDEISARPAGTDFTLRLHVKIKFRPGKAGQFSTWSQFRFACIFFELFSVSMSVCGIENPWISTDFKIFCLSCLVFSCVYSFS